MNLSEVTIGQSVILTRCGADYARGHLATVRQIVRSRADKAKRVLIVRLDTGIRAGDYYDADPANVDPFGSCPKCRALINVMGRDAGGGLHPGKGCAEGGAA